MLKSKRMLALVIAFCMVFAVMVGCGSGDVSSVETVYASSETSTPASVADSEEPVAPASAEAEASDEPEPGTISLLPAPDGTELSMWFVSEADGILEDFNDNLVAQLVEEETNIHVNYIMISMVASDTQFNLTLASGDLPDIMDNFCEMYTSGGDTAIEQDLIVDMSDYMQYAPNYSAIINENDETKLAARTDSGAIAAFFTIGADAELGPRGGHFIRKDWLDNLNLDVPVTYEDYENVLLAFKGAYDCSAAYMLGSTGIPGNSCLTAGYETSDSFINKNGEVVYGPLESGFEEYLTMMHRWFEEGLISSDFITNVITRSADIEPIINGQNGIWNDFYRADDSWKNSAADPNFEVLAIADAVKNEGDILKMGGTSGTMGRYGMSITTSCDDPAMAISWIDQWYSEDAAVRNSYGIENVTFTYNENGQPIYTDLILNSSEGSARDMRFKYTIMFSVRTIRVVSTSEDKQYDVVDRGTWQSNRTAEWDIPDTIEMSAEDGSEYARIMSDIETYVEQCVPAFITGAMDLSEYQTFCDTIRGMDIDGAIAIYQDALDRYNARTV